MSNVHFELFKFMNEHGDDTKKKEERRSGMADFMWHTPIETHTDDLIKDMPERIIMRAIEETDKFIFATIRPYCETVTQLAISKPLLERALIEYFENHPEEREKAAKVR